MYETEQPPVQNSFAWALLVYFGASLETYWTLTGLILHSLPICLISTPSA